ncbi:MAG: RNA polymerase sigma factor region1.1 domain-containing protein [Limisphaerales bacterium]
MLNRKTPTPSASRNRQRNGERSAGAKAAPVRRRFIISSNARKVAPKPAETNGKAKHTASSIATAAQKLPQNGNAAAPATTPVQSTVDLTETIKTLVHIGQEHGYVTYDDINDVLPDNLSPDDLDALLSKLRSLDVEIVMDQAEAERAERKQPEQSQQPEEAEDDSRLEILDDPVRMYMNQMGQGSPAHPRTGSRDLQKNRGSRSGDEGHYLRAWFHREGTYRHRGKTSFRAAKGTL